MRTHGQSAPSRDRLWEIASAQDGLFTRQQAAEAGYSGPLLNRYLQSGQVIRRQRGIYRLVYFPPMPDEELVAAWLWSDRQGVLSHETALSMHELSDAMPARIHMTVPEAWRTRRVRLPPGVVLEYGAVAENERTWIGAVPATTPFRTIIDCARAQISPELVDQAVKEAHGRGLLAPDEEATVRRLVRWSRGA